MLLQDILLFLIGIMFSLSDLFTKKLLVQEHILNKFIFGIAFFGASGLLSFWYCLKYFPLWKVTIIVSLVSIISSVLFSYFLLHEKITLVQLILVVAGIIVLGLLGFFSKS